MSMDERHSHGLPETQDNEWESESIGCNERTNMVTTRKKEAPRYIFVDILAVMFGISSWIEICGVGVELPLMVQRLPEKWRLASYVVIVTQLANTGPLLYGFVRRYWSPKVLEIPAIYITLGVAALSCLLLSFFWNKTTTVGGQEHSTAFLTLVFCLAFVDCTSSVLYLPYMANFRDIYVISCMIGEGMSGMLPSIVGLIQGVGGNPDCQNITVANGSEFGNETVTKLVPYIPKPRFSIEIYFIFLFCMVLTSWFAFCLLEKLPNVQKEKLSMPNTASNINREADEFSNLGDIHVRRNEYTSCDAANFISKSDYYMLLCIQMYVCVVQNGILASIQTFSCLPYGSLAYHLSVNFSMMSNPIACLIAMFFPLWTLRQNAIITIFSSVCGVYIFVAALLSPYPPLVEHTVGAILMVLSWIILVGGFSYVKACFVAILRKHSGNKGLFWGGAISQVGSFCGGVVTFALVNYTQLFQSSSSCPDD